MKIRPAVLLACRFVVSICVFPIHPAHSAESDKSGMFFPPLPDFPEMTLPSLPLGVPVLTTKESIAAEKSQALAHPPGRPPVVVPAQTTQPVRPAAAVPAVIPCDGTGGLGRLLSPECIASLGALRAPGNFSPSSLPTGQTQCSVSISERPDGARPPTLATVSFPTSGLARCIEAGARLGFGMQGITNIVATDGTTPVVAVSCRREGADGRRISCQTQPELGN